jgi:hypothetical protein
VDERDPVDQRRDYRATSVHLHPVCHPSPTAVLGVAVVTPERS